MLPPLILGCFLCQLCLGSYPWLAVSEHPDERIATFNTGRASADKARGLFAAQWAPPHLGRKVTAYLNQRYELRLSGRRVTWPPRSPDLTQLDFFLKGLMKEMTYRTNVHTREGDSSVGLCMLLLHAGTPRNDSTGSELFETSKVGRRDLRT
jgi:hypothetical protein